MYLEHLENLEEFLHNLNEDYFKERGTYNPNDYADEME